MDDASTTVNVTYLQNIFMTAQRRLVPVALKPGFLLALQQKKLFAPHRAKSTRGKRRYTFCGTKGRAGLYTASATTL
jgi:hypothetical protein